MKGGTSNQTKATNSPDFIYVVNADSTGFDAISKATGEVSFYINYFLLTIYNIWQFYLYYNYQDGL